MKKIFLLFLLFSISTVAYSWSFFSTPGSKEKVDPNQKKVDLSKYKEIVSCKKNMRWGAPKLKDMELQKSNLYFCNEHFIVQYDYSIKIPRSVSERMERHNIEAKKMLTTQDYNSDPRIPQEMQSNINDFNNSYLPIPLANPKNMILYEASINQKLVDANKKAHYESYYFTNIVPMNNQIYNQVWKNLDEYGRELTRKFLVIDVISGPIFFNGQNKGVLGANKIPIPTHFFKIFVDPGRYKSVAYIIPNENCNNCDYNKYVTNIFEIERLTGIKFFPGLVQDVKNLLITGKSTSSSDIRIEEKIQPIQENLPIKEPSVNKK